MEAERGFSKVEKDEVVHGLFRVTATVQERFCEAPSRVTTPSSHPSMRADELRIKLERFLGSVFTFPSNISGGLLSPSYPMLQRYTLRSRGPQLLFL